jgi:adenylate cyclase
MVNRDKKMFVSLLNTPEKIIVDTLPVRECLNNNQEILSVYKDYNGEEVMGASMCFVDKKWTLLVEVPTAVAFSSIDDFKLFLVTLVLAIIIIAVVGAFIVSSRITNPVKKLRDAVEVFSSGKLDERVDIKTGDEIQQLGEDFNEMAEKLSSLYGSLEQKIEERTHELREKIKELEKFKELTVGREIKMIEIKKEMEALKKELEAKKLKKEEK